jgi:hypothetical protein
MFVVQPAVMTIFATAVSVLVSVALVAGAAPTLLASRVDQMRALR